MLSINKNEVTQTYRAQRQALVQLIDSLSEAELDAPSLCEGWSVHDVLAHIISFELHYADIVKLLLGLGDIDAVNELQTKRYQHANKSQLIARLKKGEKRTLLLLRLTPTWLFDKKIIKIKNGWVSLAQLFGDLIGDRAIHFVDIAHGLNGTTTIQDETELTITLDFMLMSMYLLNPKLPETEAGKIIRVTIDTPITRNIFWQVGTNYISTALSESDLTVHAEANDFIFAVTGRKKLIRNQPNYQGDQGLAVTIEKLLNSNAFWN